MTLSIAMAEDNGYQNIEDCIREGETLKAGDKVYAQYMKKTLALFHIGTKPLTEGMNILGAHVDSPRLDVKQNPLYEDTQMAYLDTHYWWCEKIPVGDDSSCNSRRCCEKRRNSRAGRYR